MKLPPDFKDFLKLLNENEVKYLLIGGYAVGYHGYVRTTNDLDIWVNPTAYNAERVVTVLQKFGFDLPDVKVDLFLQEKRIIRMGNPPMRIELCTSISGVNFDDCFQERVVNTIDNIHVNIISLEKLKINKLASGRHKDLDDLENLP
ncbi:MAG: nucleotidyltransferase [Ignavibacteriae bacterium]|nr:nucleotidyltransferase [Ignavibacteriota bacterium]